MPEPAVPALTDAAVLAASHRYNLAVLQRMPYDLEYLAPQEILEILRQCNTYGVDWTPGLEAASGQTNRTFQVPRLSSEGQLAWVPVRVRVRPEELVEDPAGVWVPDAGIVWGMQLLGRLVRAAQAALQATGGL